MTFTTYGIAAVS